MHEPTRASPAMNETLLTTPIFDVQRRRCARSDGQPLVRDIVVHPGGVVIIPELDGKTIATLGAYLLKMPV